MESSEQSFGLFVFCLSENFKPIEMKKIILAFYLLCNFVASAQQDSTKQDTTHHHDKHLILTTIGINSKNFWRGNVYGNNAPSINATVAMHLKNHFEIGAEGTSPISGNRDGFGIWMELYTSYTLKRFTFTIDDYYFFNAKDSLNDYFNWDRNVTQHLVEGRVKYDAGRFNATGSYVLYAANTAVNSVYLEAEYFLVPKIFSVSGGAVLGQSALNFYDKGGITHVGVTGYRDIVFSKEFTLPMRVSLMTSPNYKNASKYPAFTQNPINIIVGVTF